MAVTTTVELQPAQAGVFDALDRALTAAASQPSANRAPDELDGRLAAIDTHLCRLVEMLEDLPDPLSVTQLVRCEQRLSAARLVRVANTIGSSGDATVDRRRARNQLDCSQLSRRTVRRDARRAAALAGNPHLADQMDTAGVEVEAIDALLKATDGQTGAIAVKLIDDVSGLAPDQATQVVEKYLEGSTSPNEVSTEYEQQMAARRTHRYSVGAIGGRPAMEGIGIEAPKALIDRMWSRICARADAKYQSGGGAGTPGTRASTAESSTV